MATTLETRICEMLEIDYPVVLAGMSPVARPELVAAVSEAGGLGVLGAAGMDPETITQSINHIRDLTSKPFGVDILLPQATAQVGDLKQPGSDDREAGGLPEQYLNFQAEARSQFDLPETEPTPPRGRAAFGAEGFSKMQVQAIIDAKAPVFASGLGNPAPFVEAFHENGTTVIALVGNVKNAIRVRDGGADIIVAQGTEAGGHTGRIGTLALVPQIVDVAEGRPVLAAGGIGDGRGLAASLALGAEGVWCGTAFLATDEAHLPQVLKDRVIDANEEDTRITRLYSGKTMRNVTNPLIEMWEASGISALPMGAQGVMSGPLQQAAREAGKEELTQNPAGQISGMVTAMQPAADVLTAMVDEAATILRELPRFAGASVSS
ncbi:MAG TPA: nitronate monooxygenase family protein [Dehalococcoidia bacterium]|nr:nitronate monooxygenase family protein [Dehalococcoidia bacterium]